MKTSLEVLSIICLPHEPASVGHCHYKKWSWVVDSWFFTLYWKHVPYNSRTSLIWVLYSVSTFLDWRLGFEPTLQLKCWNWRTKMKLIWGRQSWTLHNNDHHTTIKFLMTTPPHTTIGCSLSQGSVFVSCNWFTKFGDHFHCGVHNQMCCSVSCRQIDVQNCSMRSAIASSLLGCSTWSPLGAMSGKNRQLIADEAVEFEKSPVEVQDFRRITDQFRGIYRI